MSKFVKGQKVTYTPNHGDPSEKEWGVVKSLSWDINYAHVVYNCGGDWDNYEDYSAESTDVSNLTPGWEQKPIKRIKLLEE